MLDGGRVESRTLWGWHDVEVGSGNGGDAGMIATAQRNGRGAEGHRGNESTEAAVGMRRGGGWEEREG